MSEYIRVLLVSPPLLASYTNIIVTQQTGASPHNITHVKHRYNMIQSLSKITTESPPSPSEPPP